MKHIDDPALTKFLFEKLLPLMDEVSQQGTGLEVIETILYYLSKSSDHSISSKEDLFQKTTEELQFILEGLENRIS